MTRSNLNFPNVAGGDSAARGMPAGFVPGCHQGLEHIPGQWLEDMAAHEKMMGRCK